MTLWRITGDELLDAVEAETRPRRQADVRWDDGLVVEPGSEWISDRLRELNGHTIMLGPSAASPGPFTVDLTDSASAYWATASLLWHWDAEGDLPAPTWADDTPAGAVN